jgi:hypothetical protein
MTNSLELRSGRGDGPQMRGLGASTWPSVAVGVLFMDFGVRPAEAIPIVA